jgi:RNA polymerase sigma factor (sigma-70 family)
MTLELPEHYFRHEHGRLVSILSRRFGAQRIELCEDAAQAALLRAVETWTCAGVPDEPGAWLYRVAHHYVIDAMRAQKRRSAGATAGGETREAPGGELSSEDPATNAVVLSTEVPDDLLRMLFLCADPEIPYESQLALALKTLCGFSTEEIALRLFQSTDAIHKRLQRARTRLRERGTELDMPPVHEPWLLSYYLWDATWSELYRRAGDLARSLAHLVRAIDAAPTLAERTLLERRRRELEHEH